MLIPVIIDKTTKQEKINELFKLNEPLNQDHGITSINFEKDNDIVLCTVRVKDDDIRVIEWQNINAMFVEDDMLCEYSFNSLEEFKLKTSSFPECESYDESEKLIKGEKCCEENVELFCIATYAFGTHLNDIDLGELSNNEMFSNDKIEYTWITKDQNLANEDVKVLNIKHDPLPKVEDKERRENFRMFVQSATTYPCGVTVLFWDELIGKHAITKNGYGVIISVERNSIGFHDRIIVSTPTGNIVIKEHDIELCEVGVSKIPFTNKYIHTINKIESVIIHLNGDL